MGESFLLVQVPMPSAPPLPATPCHLCPFATPCSELSETWVRGMEAGSGCKLRSFLAHWFGRAVGGSRMVVVDLEKVREEKWLAGNEPKRLVRVCGGSSRVPKGIVGVGEEKGREDKDFRKTE